MEYVDKITRKAAKSIMDLSNYKRVITHIYKVVDRIIKEHPKAAEYQSYLKVVVEGAEKQVTFAIKCQAELNLQVSSQNSNWQLNSGYLSSFDDSNSSLSFHPEPPKHKARVNINNNLDGGGMIAAAVVVIIPTLQSLVCVPKSSSELEDERYRKLIQNLSKSLKNFRIKSLTIHSDPRVRREKFRNWVTDLQNVFSTH